jgi:hypothetical protein
MIPIHSKILDPILLERTIRKVVEEGERNVVIYLSVRKEIDRVEGTLLRVWLLYLY